MRRARLRSQWLSSSFALESAGGCAAAGVRVRIAQWQRWQHVRVLSRLNALRSLRPQQ
jgi:hypothetical protein